jgi:hypothetical protein
MVFISQPRPVANDNHWAVGSYAVKHKDHRDGRVPNIGFFARASGSCACNGGLGKGGRVRCQDKARTRGFLQSHDSECILRWHKIVELRAAARGCQPGHGQRVALGVTEVPEQRALLAASKRSINRLSRER